MELSKEARMSLVKSHLRNDQFETGAVGSNLNNPLKIQASGQKDLVPGMGSGNGKEAINSMDL